MRTGTPGFRAGRLTEAREARGLTQTSLSELTGLKSQSISHYEQGRQSPSPDALAMLSEALDLPARFFLKSAPEFRANGIFFRNPPTHTRLAVKQARVSVARRLGWLKEVALYARRYVDLPACALPDCPVAETATGDQIERAAAAVRAVLNTGVAPLGNLISLLEAKGCIVARIPMDDELEGSCSHFEAGIPYLLLQAGDAGLAWQRYNVAHELGHLVMHRHIELFAAENPESHKRIEAQADRFARALLLPAEAFGKEVWAPNIDALLTLKKDWRCPVSVMVQRCGELGLFDADQVRRAGVNLVRRGWKVTEPRDEPASREKPQLLASCLRLLVDEGLKDRHSILLDLGMNGADIEELAGLERGYFAEGKLEVSGTLRLRRTGLPGTGYSRENTGGTKSL